MVYEDQNSGFSCTADGVTEVTIHCSGVGAETSLQCSFDNGPFHSCKPCMHHT